MYPVPKEELDAAMARMNIDNIAAATIRQILALANIIESTRTEPVVHLEMGNPGLPASEIGIQAEHEAMLTGIANRYPNITGIKPLKDAGSRFLKSFLDLDIPARCIVPTVGSMQGTFTLMMLLAQRLPGRDTVLFLDPGFPAQHHQAKLLGINQRSIDVYDCRGAALEARLEEAVADGRVTALLYSNPNNPAWFNFTDEEFQILARVAERHDLIIMEDHAYMGMDFRRDFSTPGQAPFIPTVARYSDRAVLLVSASKIFSYAGQRIAIVCFSPEVFDREYEFFAKFYDMPSLGDAYMFGVLYCASSGTCHSAQFAMARMLEAACDGKLNFVEQSREYGRRAALAKKAFTDAGFHIVYDRDGDEPISDGFFFTVGRRGWKGPELQRELLRYGVSTISLPATGSLQEGLRVCVSMLSDPETFRQLSSRLAKFNNDYPLAI